MRKRKMGDLDGLEKPKRAFWAIVASWDEMRLHYLNRLRKEGVRDRSGRLLTFQKEGDTLAAKGSLHRAMGYTPYLTDYLLGRSALPDDIPEQITMGEEDEAQSYADKFLLVWQKVDGALSWVEQQEKIHQQMKDVAGKLNRNDPCICGSGRKQKECCVV